MKKVILLAIWLFTVISLLIFSPSISQITYESLQSCLKNIFPLLFPYSVLASLMVSLGIGELLGKIIPVNKLFLMPRISSAPIICGAVCGFPLGAKVACDMYENGALSKQEAEMIVSISNNTGPVFIINIIGAVYFSSIEVGIVIYISQIASALMISLILYGNHINAKEYSYSVQPLGKALSDSIRTSFISCLYICGYISIFSSLIYAASFIPGGLSKAISSFIEFTAGAKLGAGVGGGVGIFMAAFSVAWSGFSVICQTMSFTYPLGLSIKPLIKFKLMQGLLCAVICTTYFSKARSAMLISLILLTALLYRIRQKEITLFSKLREN